MDVEQRARDALNAAEPWGKWIQGHHTRENNAAVDAVCRLIEQQDAFAREVSDAAKYVADSDTHPAIKSALGRFILPEPVDNVAIVAREMVVADGVVRTANQRKAILDARSANDAAAEHERRLREALAKRGLSIVPTVDGEGAK